MTDNRMNMNDTAGIDLTHAIGQVKRLLRKEIPDQCKWSIGINLESWDFNTGLCRDYWRISFVSKEGVVGAVKGETLHEAYEAARKFLVEQAMNDINNPERMEV